MVKFITAILFSCLILSTTEFRQLLRLPFLIQHYCKHKTEDRKLSFFSFLKLHYVHEEDKGNDDREDDQLPFKNVSDLSMNSSYLPMEKVIIPNTPVISLSKKIPPHQSFIPSQIRFQVFHPPRIC